jgi:murein tripeptide amidase MpaA
MKLSVVLLICAIVASASAASAKRPKHTMDFNHFWTFSEIDHYLEDLLEEFPDLTFEETYGRTSEGREIEAFVIRKGGASGPPKPTIIVESGLRAREWLGPMAAMYIIHEIVEHPYNFEDIIDKVDLVFIPVVNIDGYVFSFTAGNRMWNKNRRSVGNGCFGVDLDRNFQFSFTPTTDVSSMK